MLVIGGMWSGWQGEVPWRVTLGAGALEAAPFPGSPRGELSDSFSMQQPLELSPGFRWLICPRMLLRGVE